MKPVAVITGASRGIGRAIALKLAAENYHLALCARNTKNLKLLQEEILSVKSGIEVLIYPCDVSDKKQIKEFGKAVLKKFKKVDLLVNNAGVFIGGKLHEEKEGTLEKLMDTNLFSAYYMSRAVIPAMKKAKSGLIVNISSIAGIKAYDAGGSYSISKFAMQGLGKSLREELKEFNIRVTSILPGATLTDSWKGTNLPESRFIKAEDVAALVSDIAKLSENSVVEEVLIRPVLGDL